MTQDTITQRIKNIIDTEKNLMEFAKKINKHDSIVRNMLSRGTKPSFDMTKSIITAYQNLNLRWFFLGKGEMWNDREEKKIIKGDGNMTQIGNGHVATQNNTIGIECKEKLKAAQREIELLNKSIADKERLITILEQLTKKG